MAKNKSLALGNQIASERMTKRELLFFLVLAELSAKGDVKEPPSFTATRALQIVDSGIDALVGESENGETE